MTEITAASMQGALLHVCDLIISAEPMLTEIDSIIGDGDHGFGMKDGFTELKAALSEKQYQTLYELTRDSGMALVKAMGGASGVIFGTLLIGGHNALVAEDKSLPASADAAAMRRYFRMGAEAIMRRGRASAGDKTMLDALLPAVEAMEQSDTEDIIELFRLAWEGACRGAEATKSMAPRLGRAKNFRETAIGYPDPGAVSTSIIFKGLYESFLASK